MSIPKMMKYRPWAEGAELINPEEFCILDIELGGGCNAGCIYCDADYCHEMCTFNMDRIHQLIMSGKIKQVYVCGLGEPTHCSNLNRLLKLLEWCEEAGILLSMFTNVIRLTKKEIEFLKNGTLNLLFKFDTLTGEKIPQLYGISNTNRIFDYLQNMCVELSSADAKFIVGNTTNVGASIVPTRINEKELQSLISFCLRNQIFPLVGQLENAGACIHNFQELNIPDDRLQQLKDYLLSKYGIDYKMPLCPATISGIHIRPNGDVVVDAVSGSSCPYFWLTDPQYHLIGNINDPEMNYDRIVAEIKAYRNAVEQQEAIQEQIKRHSLTPNKPFGGCGGTITDVLNHLQK